MSSQGQSRVTFDKERCIGASLSVGMTIANARFGGRGLRYFHFDANAGSGWNDEVDTAGSPLVAWQAAAQLLPRMTFVPFFCDNGKGVMEALWERLDTHSRRHSILIPGDNAEALEVFAEHIRLSGEKKHFAVGSILIDPNGYFYDTAVPVKPLQAFCDEFPRIDIVLNLDMRAFYLQRGCGHDVMPPRDVLASLGKSHWLVRGLRRGNARRLLAVGRNVRTGDHPGLGLYDSESNIGRAILDAEAKQGALFNVQDLSRVPGASRVPGGAEGGDAQGQWPVQVRRPGNRSAPHSLSTMGHVRRAIEPAADVSSLPLFGARQE